MAFQMGKGFVEFLLRDSRFRRGIKASVVALQKMQMAMRTAARWARNALLVMGGGFVALMKVASSAEEIGSKFTAVFKEETKAAETFVRILARAVNRSVNDLKKYMAALQDTFFPMGFARKEARLMSQQLVKLGVDVASFQDKVEADVLRDFQSALVGNHETVRKYGILIDEAGLKQELLNMGFAGGTEKAIKLAKIQARMNIIMGGTVDAQGDAVKTAGALANQWRGLVATAKDLAAAFGAKVLPATANFVGTLRAAITVIGRTKDGMQSLWQLIKDVGKVLISIWVAAKLFAGMKLFIAGLILVAKGLIAVGVAAKIAIVGVVGLGVVVTALAAGFALIAIEALKAKAAIFAVMLASQKQAKLVTELGDIRKALRTAEGADRIPLLKREIAIRERLAEIEKETARTAEERHIADSANVRAKKWKEPLKAKKEELAWLERGQKVLKERAKTEKKIADAARLAAAGVKDAAKTAAKAQIRPEFVGMTEMYRRLATAGRADSKEQEEMAMAKERTSDTRRTRQAVEKMAGGPADIPIQP